MDLTAIRSLARNLCFEGDDDDGLTNDPQLDALINSAHRKLWTQMVNLSSTPFTIVSGDTTIPTAGYAYEAIATAGVMQIKRVQWKDQGGNYIQVDYLDPEEVQRVGPQFTLASGGQPAGWTRQGFNLHLVPDPAVSAVVKLTYVPGVTPLATGADVPFNGHLTHFHDIVAFGAANLALAKDKANKFVKPELDEKWKLLEAHITSLQRQRPRRIHRTDVD